jgi:hypothetical protein
MVEREEMSQKLSHAVPVMQEQTGDFPVTQANLNF